jgi:uncharacterized protein YqjF (DUF2071 family)
MRVTEDANAVRYRCRRRDEPGHHFSGTCMPSGEAWPAEPGTLEHFLTERYCLYAVADGRVYRAEVHHPPWPLQRASADIGLNTMPPEGLELEGAPLLHFAARQDVLVWPLEEAGR